MHQPNSKPRSCEAASAMKEEKDVLMQPYKWNGSYF